MPNTFLYDIFLSHSTHDKPAVRELAERLKRDGLRVWFDEWEIKPGDMITKRIDDGLEASRILVLVMSQHAFASDWATLESGTFRFRDPTNKDRRFIPLRLDDAEIKDALKQFAYVDWRNQSRAEYARLLTACRPEVAETKSASDSKQKIQQARVLEGHTSQVNAVAISADGRRAVSGSYDDTVRVWDLEAGKLVATLKGHTKVVWGVALSADGRRAVSGSEDNTVRVWDLEAGKLVATLKGHTSKIFGVALSADGRWAVSVSQDRTVRVWDLEARKLVAKLEGHTGEVNCVALSADGRRAISGADDHTVRVWDVEAGKLVVTPKGRSNAVWCVALSADGRRAVSGSSDEIVQVWDVEAGKLIAKLEGHTRAVRGVALSADGRRAVSGSYDDTVRVWDLEAGKLFAMLEGHTDMVFGVAISVDGRRVVSSSHDKTVRVWDLPPITSASLAVTEAARYTNAKVLLVGESGVGKTGLAYRLTENVFKDSVSTDAAWATQLKLPDHTAPSGMEREIWLWDFAGQADYRLIHQLYMDETALAVLVFNPQSENPFEGLGGWDRDLQRAARRPFKKLLVAGRVDRGGLMLSQNTIEQFQKERGFAGYLETSALTGAGCDTLREAIVRHIPWNEIPWTASPRIFKLLKEQIVKLKDEGLVLLRVVELKQQLEMRLPGERFTDDELRAVIGLLAGPGIVWQLEFGDFVLLQPERVNAYAAAVIRSVRAHVEEIGSINEEDVLAGKLDYQDMKRLPHGEEQIVLRAMHQTFVDHGLCLREHTAAGTLLVFPSYFKRERPELEGHPAVFVSYQFSGPLDEIYATLVVRLHHTPTFDKDQLWRFAADFKTPAGKRLGFKMTKKPEGAAELEVYFESGVPDDTQVTFIRYVHEHLKLKAPDVVRLRHYVCPHCGTPVENRKTALERLEEGKKDIVCVKCEQRILLWDLIEQKFASEEFQRRVRELEEESRASIDNESRELAAEAHTMFIVAEAGQIWRRTSELEGIDGEIEFRDYQGNASGRRLYIQLKSGDSYLRKRKEDGEAGASSSPARADARYDDALGAEIFTLKNERHAEYWQQQAYPVMLVIRASDGMIRWMNISAYLKRESTGGKKVKQIIFSGEPLTALNLLKVRGELIGPPPERRE
jgi:small GTP-binding protein